LQEFFGYFCEFFKSSKNATFFDKTCIIKYGFLHKITVAKFNKKNSAPRHGISKATYIVLSLLFFNESFQSYKKTALSDG